MKPVDQTVDLQGGESELLVSPSLKKINNSPMNFCSINDVDDPKVWVEEALELKKEIETYGPKVYTGKSICLLFFNQV